MTNDPIVLSRARALLTSTSSPTAFIDADLRAPGKILSQAAEMARFFDGLELVEPGIVQLHHWRPAVTGPTAPSSGYDGAGRKP